MLSIEPIYSVQSRADFLTELVRFAHSLDFPTVDVTAFVRRSPESDLEDHIYVDNLPRSDEWKSLDPSLGRRCPVMQHCRFHSTPVMWGHDTYADPNIADIYDVVASLGLRSGVSVSLHLPLTTFQLSLHSDQHVDRRHAIHVCKHVREFAALALVPAADLLFKPRESELQVKLTPFELEALRLASDGLDDESTARRMNVSVSDAQMLRSLATATLGCASMQAATLKALRLGII